MKKIQGHPGLARNKSGVVCSIDNTAFEQARKRKRKLDEDARRMTDLEARVEQLEQLIQDKLNGEP